MSYADLFFTFLYIGAFTIGGGLVAITLMQQQLVEKNLISVERFYNMVAVSESTPGPIGINMATYLGFEFHGIPGALIATAGTVLPSLIVIIIIARFFHSFRNTPGVRAVFYGLRAGTTGMIAVAAWRVIAIAVLAVPAFQESGRFLDLFEALPIILFLTILAVYLKFTIHPVFFILFGAVFGIFFL
ncbi:MAG TPA: chromate transporter [Treponema sp.]|nr:chromate transporter [Treponema sp.]